MPPNHRFDIIICGGSLAGIATAIRLYQLGHKPLVLEKSHFPRKKLCGEFLGPSSLPALERLSVLELVSQVAYGPVSKARFYMAEGKLIEVPMGWINQKYPYGLAISRERLDSLLMNHARSLGISVWEGHRVHPHVQCHVENNAEKFTLNVIAQNQTQQLETAILIDATGRHGGLRVTEKADGLLKTDSNVGVKCHVAFPEPLPGKDLQMFLFPGGYGGIQPLSEGTANLCMLLRSSLVNSLKKPFPQFIDETIGQNPVAKKQLKHCQRIEPFQTTANLNLTPQTTSPLIQVGDAMLTVDPVTGSGMSMALQSGILAAEMVHAGFGQSYRSLQANYRQRYHHQFQNKLRWLKLIRPLLFQPKALRCSLPIIRPIMPYLVRIIR